MARVQNKLTVKAVASLPPGRHSDGNGLYLNVKPSGARSWVFIYHDKGKRKERGLGGVAKVSLAEARALVRNYEPPAETPLDETFGAVATSLIAALKPSWKNTKHAAQWTSTLKTHAALLWDKPVADVTTTHVMEVLSPIWTTIPETATRVRSRVERVLDAAKVRGLRSGDNPARWRGHLDVILPKRTIQSRSHFPSMPFKQVPEFVKEVRHRPALSARALEFLILTAARTGEVIKADWAEFDTISRLWIIPAGRMKVGREHRVPLTDRAIDILEHLRFLGGEGPFRVSNMAMEQLLRRMDRDEWTVHGFRSSFRDWVAEETDFPRELAEQALAHQVGNAVERAYRRGDALDKRRVMMEAWTAYLE